MPPDRPSGFVPPIYPYFRLDALKQRAAEAPGGIVDLSVGTPNDPVLPPSHVRDCPIAGVLRRLTAHCAAK